MILFLSEEHKEHLKILQSVSNPVFSDFCKLTVDFIINGPNHKKYGVAANKLELSTIDIQNTVQAIAYLIVESCKYNLSEQDFKMSTTIAGFTDNQQEILLKLYNQKKTEIMQGLVQLTNTSPSYEDLSWRFEVQVASKMAEEEIKPAALLNLKLKTLKNIWSSDTVHESHIADNIPHSLNVSKTISDARTTCECRNIITNVLLQCDLPNLLNMTSKLEQALLESKSPHVRKVHKVLQNTKI